MDADAVREKIIERVFDLSPEEFEYVSKIVVEQIENPYEIELTPFQGDGGIDIRGTVGREVYSARFAVQVKRYKDNVTAPAMRNFLGAISQHNYQFGTFITNSGFSGEAKKIADAETETPITLINGERLAELLLSQSIGVEDTGHGYSINEDFWAFGTTSEGDDLVKSAAVPQADTIETVHLVLRAVDDGYRVKPRIREYMIAETGDDWTPRQADYYSQAAWTLGYLHKDAQTEYQGRKMRQWGLTRDGEEYLMYLRADENKARSDLLTHVRESDVIQRVMERLREADRISHSELGDIIEAESELNDTTADRRRGTVGTWLDMLPDVRRFQDGRSYEYEYVESNLNDY